MTNFKLPDIRPPGRYSRRCRIFTLTALFAAATLQLTTRTAIAADPLVQPVTLDISSGTPLEDALIEWGRKAGLTVMIDTRSVTGLQTSGVHGTFNTGDALKLLLRNSGLAFTKQGQIVHIVQSNRATRFERGGTGSAELPSTDSDFDLPVSQGGESDSVASESGSRIEEVLVTAEKKGVAERLQDVPVPISVISAQALMETNKNELQDYFNQIPGLEVAQSGPATLVSIRGITTGQNNNPTVGFTLDDVPLGGSQNAISFMIPVIDPADLAQVEVLRGPQGTLYGDNSMGGLIRYVTVDPSTDRVFGDVRVGSDEVFNGTHLGYNTSAAINLPLTETLAMRISAFTRLDPGYIDDVETGARGVNTIKTGGGRISAKWTPSTDLTLKFSALYEKSDQYGASGVDVPTSGFPQTAGLSGLEQIWVRGSGTDDQEMKNASLTLNANLGSVKLTTISGYTVSGQNAVQDGTWTGLASVVNVPNSASLGAPLLSSGEMHKFTQEVRLTDTLGSHLEWLLGGFYTKENLSGLQEWSVTEPSSGVLVGAPGNIYYAGGPSRFTETAGFAALTVKATDQFDVQFGGRESYLSTPSLSQGGYSGGVLNGGEPPGPSTYLPPSSEYWKDNAFTYMVSPRFRLTSDAMIYARVADGFRPGSGVSNPAPGSPCLIHDYQCLIHPDKNTDYEIGAKVDFLKHTLSIDSSVYYIDWKDIQLRLNSNTSEGLTYTGNGSGAKSQGVDLSLNWTPIEGLTISTWGAWNDAVLTKPFADGAAGQPLPYSARFSSNFSVEKDVLIAGDIHAFFSGKEIYMGERLGEFTALNSPRQNMPAYSQTDLNAGVKAHPWTFNLYVNNVTDRRGVLYGGIGGWPPYEYIYINPRTVGLSVVRTF